MFRYIYEWPSVGFSVQLAKHLDGELEPIAFGFSWPSVVHGQDVSKW